MRRFLLAGALGFVALLPNMAAACFPQNPYFYTVRGAYLFVFLFLGLAVAFELFRYLAQKPLMRDRLRRCSFGLAILALVMMLIACAYAVLEESWERDFADPALVLAGKRC